MMDVKHLRQLARYHGDLGRSFLNLLAKAAPQLANDLRTRGQQHIQWEKDLCEIAHELETASGALEHAGGLLKRAEETERELRAEIVLLQTENKRLLEAIPQ